MAKYYVDTAIWIDLYEDRKGFREEPLGDYAWRLFSAIKQEKNELFISELLIEELFVHYSMPEIKGMMLPFQEIIKRVQITKEEVKEASIISRKRRLPKGDVLHAVLARDNKSILITRDKHFRELVDICQAYKPEEII